MKTRFFAITRKQREALFRVFQRDFPSWISPKLRYDRPCCPNCGYGGPAVQVPTYHWRKFRKSVWPTYDKSGAVMVHWKGMWLGIEPDGYTHS